MGWLYLSGSRSWGLRSTQLEVDSPGCGGPSNLVVPRQLRAREGEISSSGCGDGEKRLSHQSRKGYFPTRYPLFLFRYFLL